jgi:hypothetical protein
MAYFDPNNIQPQAPQAPPMVMPAAIPNGGLSDIYGYAQGNNSGTPPAQSMPDIYSYAQTNNAPTPAPQTPPVPQSAPVPQQNDRQYLENLALLASTKRTAYTPGISQEQLQKRAAKGVATPQTETSSASGASPEALEKLQAAADNHVEAIHDQSIADKLQANANLDNAAADATAKRQLVEKQAAEQAAKDTDWQQKWDAFQQQNSPENNQVDPNRFFSRVGVLGSILAVVGSMYEAKGAALGHTQNPQTVMRLIDNDIRAQQLEMMQKGQAANNQLAQLSRQWGSLDAGRAALKTLESQALEAKLRETSAQTNDPALKAHIDAAAAQAVAGVQEGAAQTRLANDRVASQQQSAVLYPQAAKGGGTTIDYGKRLSMLKDLRGEDRENRKLDIAEAEANGKTISPEQAEKDAVRGSTISSLERYAQAQGFVQNPKTGQYEKPEGWVSQLPHGAGYKLRHPSNLTANTVFATEKQEGADAALDNSATLATKGLYGERTTPEAIKLTKKQLSGSRAGEEAVRLNEMLNTLKKQKELSGGAVNARQRASAARNIARDRSLDAVTPVAPDELVQ